MPNLHLNFCIDTEGPLVETIGASFKRIREISGLKIEASLENLPGNKELLNQLKNIYGALGDNANFKRILGMLEQ